MMTDVASCPWTESYVRPFEVILSQVAFNHVTTVARITKNNVWAEKCAADAKIYVSSATFGPSRHLARVCTST